MSEGDQSTTDLPAINDTTGNGDDTPTVNITGNHNSSDKIPFPKLLNKNGFYAYRHKAMTWFKAHNLDHVVLGINAPKIPSLIKAAVQTIILEDGTEMTGNIRGNEAEVKKAESDNKGWINKDRIALARITNSLADDLLYIVESCASSQGAWNALYDEFAPSDEATVVTHQSDFFSNHCTLDMDVSQWLTDQRKILARIKAAGGRIDDKLIVQFILGQLPDETWGSFVDMHVNKRINSSTLFSLILQRYRKMHRSDDANLQSIFTARYSSTKRSKGGVYQLAAIATKDAPFAAKLTCDNCHRPNHTKATCYRPGGGKESTPPAWWKSTRAAKDIKDAKDKRPSLAARINMSDTELVSPAVQQERNTGEENDIAMMINVFSAEIVKSNIFYHDSCANRHIAWDRGIFHSYETIKPVTIGGFGEGLEASGIGIGSIKIRCILEGKTVDATLHDVLHVPMGRSNLISESCLNKRGIYSSFNQQGITLTKKTNTIAIGTQVNGLFVLDIEALRPTAPTEDIRAQFLAIDSGFFHRLMAHRDVKGAEGALDGIVLTNSFNPNSTCETCARGKIKVLSFPHKAEHRAARPFERIHSDVQGPLIRGHGNFRFFVSLIDDYSRYCWVYMLSSKTEVTQKIKDFYARVTTKYNARIV